MTAGFTLAVFTLTNLGWVSSVYALVPTMEEFKLPAKVEIPQSLGTLQSFFLPEDTDKPLVIYIQDAHAVADAQKNIWGLIAHFQSAYPVRQVLLEGLSGRMDVTLLRSFPDSFIREKIMRDYFSRGEMTGAEMAAVLNPEGSSYEGLEDAGLYEENTRAYLEVSSNQPALHSEIQAQEKMLETKRRQFYSPAQKELHGLVEDFNSDTGRFFELIHYLVRFQEEARRYPRVKVLLKNIAQENPDTQKNQESQVGKMAEAFRVKQLGRLSPGNQRVFQEKFQAFRTRQLDAGIFLQAFWGETHSYHLRAML